MGSKLSLCGLGQPRGYWRPQCFFLFGVVPPQSETLRGLWSFSPEPAPTRTWISCTISIAPGPCGLSTDPTEPEHPSGTSNEGKFLQSWFQRQASGE